MENNKPIMDMDDELEQLAKELSKMREVVEGLHENIRELIRQRDEAVAKLNELMSKQSTN
jgi:archaellum component FlaC